VWWWRCLLLVGLHVVEGLQHCLHELVLGDDQLFKVNIVVGVVAVVVIVAGLAIALAISCVHHLMA
jgi:succinate dehydrogenase hydrophobic anchor subunit